MSTKGVILALVVAIGLALATMALLITQGVGSNKTPVAIPAGERILAAFDPARLRSMDVTLGSTTDRLTPDTTPGDWKLETALQTPTGRTWPVDSERFRSVLRVLAETRAAGTPAPDAGVGENPATIRLTLDDGSTLTLRLASRRLGGQAVISIESTPPTTSSGTTQPATASGPPRLALVADSLPNLFTSPGPRGWRRTQLLTGVSLSAVGVRMVTPEASLALARDAGVWSLREPTPATADPEAIRRLFSTLEQVRITRFFDDAAPKPSEAGFDAPTARVILNLERRRAGADDVAIDRSDLELTIGSKADATGSTLFATLDEGRTIVAIDTAALSTLSTDPARWISPFALAATPAEVAGLAITPTSTTPPPAASATTPRGPPPPPPPPPPPHRPRPLNYPSPSAAPSTAGSNPAPAPHPSCKIPPAPSRSPASSGSSPPRPLNQSPSPPPPPSSRSPHSPPSAPTSNPSANSPSPAPPRPASPSSSAASTAAIPPSPICSPHSSARSPRPSPRPPIASSKARAPAPPAHERPNRRSSSLIVSLMLVGRPCGQLLARSICSRIASRSASSPSLNRSPALIAALQAIMSSTSCRTASSPVGPAPISDHCSAAARSSASATNAPGSTPRSNKNVANAPISMLRPSSTTTASIPSRFSIAPSAPSPSIRAAVASIRSGTSSR
jgi:hypothetical protein